MLRFCDSVDLYNTISDAALKWSTFSGTLHATEGRFGGKCLKMTGSSSFQFIVSDVEVADIAIAFAAKVSAAPATRGNFLLLNNGTNGTTFGAGETTGLQINANGTLAYWVGLGSTSTTSGSINICDNNYHWIELRLKIADSGGIMQVYVDGVLDLNFSGDTRIGTPTLNSVSKVNFASPSGSSTVWLDDIIIYNSTVGTTAGDFVPATNFPIGDCKIEVLAPSGAGDLTQWTPSVGANYAAVDDATPNGDTDYVEATVSGYIDSYAFGDFAADPTSVKGVVVSAIAKNAQGGSFGLITRAKSSSSTAESQAINLTGNYKAAQALFAQDPATSTSWTASGVNSAEFGIKVA